MTPNIQYVFNRFNYVHMHTYIAVENVVNGGDKRTILHIRTYDHHHIEFYLFENIVLEFILHMHSLNLIHTEMEVWS